MEAKTLKATLKETKQHTCEIKLQSLPNLTRKKKAKIQLKEAQ
jgi:hypothetical protein